MRGKNKSKPPKELFDEYYSTNKLHALESRKYAPPFLNQRGDKFFGLTFDATLPKFPQRDYC